MKTVTYDENKWKLVPKEPTAAMLGAGLRWFDCMGNMPRAWSDMLAASPSPADSGEVKP